MNKITRVVFRHALNTISHLCKKRNGTMCFGDCSFQLPVPHTILYPESSNRSRSRMQGSWRGKGKSWKSCPASTSCISRKQPLHRRAWRQVTIDTGSSQRFTDNITHFIPKCMKQETFHVYVDRCEESQWRREGSCYCLLMGFFFS